MKVKQVGLALNAMVLVCAVTLVQAAEPPSAIGDLVSQKKGKASANDAGLQEFAMAQQLARYGLSHNDPLYLLAAAKIMKQNPPKAEAKTKTTEGGGADDDKAKSSQDTSSPEGLIAKAKELSSGKPELIAMVDQVANYTAPKSRGRMGGAAKHHDRIKAGGIDAFSVVFEGGKLARVAVVGDGDTDLDCVVMGAQRSVIAIDTGHSDDCLLSWVPDDTGTFVIGIKNHGAVSNRYVLLTN